MVLSGSNPYVLSWISLTEPADPNSPHNVNVRLSLSAADPTSTEIVLGGVLAESLTTCSGDSVQWDRPGTTWDSLSTASRDALVEQVQFASQRGWVNSSVALEEVSRSEAEEVLQDLSFVRVRTSASKPESRTLAMQDGVNLELNDSRQIRLECGFQAKPFWSEVPHGMVFEFPTVALFTDSSRPLDYMHISRGSTIAVNDWNVRSTVGQEPSYQEPGQAQLDDWRVYYGVSPQQTVQIQRYAVVIERERARSLKELELLSYGAAAALVGSVAVAFLLSTNLPIRKQRRRIGS